jgi:hypothetical protein
MYRELVESPKWKGYLVINGAEWNEDLLYRTLSRHPGESDALCLSWFIAEISIQAGTPPYTTDPRFGRCNILTLSIVSVVERVLPGMLLLRIVNTRAIAMVYSYTVSFACSASSLAD